MTYSAAAIEGQSLVEMPLAIHEPAIWSSRTASDQARRAAQARHRCERKGNNGKGDPATSDRAYSTAELEFMNAMQAYKQQSGRMFPTWSEVLEVLTSLGYRKPKGAAGESANDRVVAL